MLAKAKDQLRRTFNEELLERLFETYQLVGENYCLGKYRASALEAGRFAEIGIRMLQQVTTGNLTPLGNKIENFSDEVFRLSQFEKGRFSDSIRIQIPRVLQVIYDLRNKRDIGHVGGDLDANYTDATLSLSSASWVLAEFLRLYFTANIDEAQKIVNTLVRVRVPLIQEFGGFLKILKPNLSLPGKVLALLYNRGSDGATVSELHEWLKYKVRKDHMDVTLNRLEFEKAYLHRDGDKCFITDLGTRFIEPIIEQGSEG